MRRDTERGQEGGEREREGGERGERGREGRRGGEETQTWSILVWWFWAGVPGLATENGGRGGGTGRG